MVLVRAMNHSFHHTLRPFTAGPFARLASYSGLEEPEPSESHFPKASSGHLGEYAADSAPDTTGGVLRFGDAMGIQFPAYKTSSVR